MSYSAVSRKAGFKSVSFVRDVSLGKKSLSYPSLLKLSSALGLKSDAREYFLLLASLSEPDLNPSGLEQKEIELKLSKLKSQIIKKREIKGHSTNQKKFRWDLWPEVYASLGDPQTGAPLDTVVRLSQLPQSLCSAILNEMIDHGYVKKDPDTGHYITTDSHLVFSDLGQNDFFKSNYLRSIKKMTERAETDFDSSNALFLNSVFSVNKEQIPQFKEELRSLIVRFINQAEDANGDTLARIVIGFCSNQK